MSIHRPANILAPPSLALNHPYSCHSLH